MSEQEPTSATASTRQPRQPRQARQPREKQPHWLDPAIGKFGEKTVAGVRDVLRVSGLFCVYPVFWALFYQMVTAKKFYNIYKGCQFFSRALGGLSKLLE